MPLCFATLRIAILLLAIALLVPSPCAFAAEMPVIKASAENTVPACVTPGRLMTYLKENNSDLATKYDGVATEYMRLGEKLAVRWDFAFFQMLVETAFLKYTGDVQPDQNNFAGLGATGRGVRGESFKDVPTGIKAHLEHLLLYSGEHLENPTAERTRKIQEWNVLTKWQESLDRPITFKDMTSQWAPGSKSYPRDIEFVSSQFFDGTCKRPDPQPDLVLAARGGEKKVKQDLMPATANLGASSLPGRADSKTPDKTSVAETPKEDRKIKDPAVKAGAGTSPAVKVLNKEKQAPASSENAAKSVPEKDSESVPENDSKNLETASIAGAANQAGQAIKAEAASKKEVCRVWTASYGGTKAVIIKAVADQIINYTVLNVHEGEEKREASAYIVAYAKGGEAVDEYSNPTAALEKAFELCPEG